MKADEALERALALVTEAKQILHAAWVESCQQVASGDLSAQRTGTLLADAVDVVGEARGGLVNLLESVKGGPST